MDPYNTTTSVLVSISTPTAPSPQISKMLKFTNETPIKIEEVEDDAVMANNSNDFLETTMSDDHDDASAHVLDHARGHPLEMRQDEHDLDQSCCFSSSYLSNEVAFDSSSFKRFLSHADSHNEDEHSSTRPSSRLHNFYTPEQDLGYDQEDDEEVQRQQQYHYHRESSLASVVTRRFSDLSLGTVAESPMNHASSMSSEVSNASLASSYAPFTFSSASSSAPSLFTSPSTSNAFTISAILASVPATTATATATTATTSSSSASSSASVAPSSSVYFPPTASALHQKRRKVLKQKIQVPRPKNCFMLYRSKVLPMIMAELGSINNKIISKIAAERWRAETEPVKIWYRDMAKYGKEEHARNNPGYKYAPLNKMRMMAATAVSRLVQQPEQTVKNVATSVECADGVDMMDVGVDTNRDYIDESSPSRRRSARQRQQQQQQQHQRQQTIASRSGLRSQVSKRGNLSGLGLDGHSSSPFSQNKKPRDTVVHQVSYPPLNFSADPFSSLHSTDTTGFSLFDQQQQQQQNRMPTYQAYHPLAGPSIYNLTADKNASEETLVDPVDHWTTHRYQDGRNYFDASLSSFLSLSNSSSVYKSKLDGGASMMSPAKLMMIDPKILLEKELPPLPHEMKTAVHSNSHNHSHKNATNKTALLPPLPSSCSSHSNNNDPDSIMTQMFLEYNPPPLSQQQYQQQPLHYNRQPQNQHHFQVHVHEQNPFQQAFHQHTQQQQYHHQQYQQHQNHQHQHQQHQHQHQQHQHQHQGGTPYFIKAACPTGFMSFTGATSATATAAAAQGSMLLMDMLSSPWAKS